MWALKRIESVRRKRRRRRQAARPAPTRPPPRRRLRLVLGDRRLPGAGRRRAARCSACRRTWKKPIAQFRRRCDHRPGGAEDHRRRRVGTLPGRSARHRVRHRGRRRRGRHRGRGVPARVRRRGPPAGRREGARGRCRGAARAGPDPGARPQVLSAGHPRHRARRGPDPDPAGGPATASSWPTRAKACPASQAPPRSSTGGPEAPTSSSASHRERRLRLALPPLSERLDRRRPCTWGSGFNGGGAPPGRSSGGHGTNAACRWAGPCSRRSAGQTWNA